jgi:hypothetical protein
VVCGLASIEYCINITKISESSTHYKIFSALSRRYKNIFLEYSFFLDGLDMLYGMKNTKLVDKESYYANALVLVYDLI